MKSLSVIIPALNEEKSISLCLDALERLDTKGLVTEIIVVDNGSTDNTAELCRSRGATVLNKDGGTIGALRNLGARASRCDLVAFLDADCIVPQDWLEKTLPHIVGGGYAAVGFRMTIPENANWVARSWDMLFAKRDVTAEVDWLPTGNMIVTREAFMSVGGFNESLETNEDYDLCFRLRNKGYRMISCADAAVVHLRPPHSLVQVFRKELWHGKEVFRVFLDDMRSSGSLNILRRKNSKVVLYALLYLMFILLICGSLALAVNKSSMVPLVVAIILPLLTSFFVSIKYAGSAREGSMIPGLTVLLTVYGVSRALGLLPYDKLKKIIPGQSAQNGGGTDDKRD
jgi:glycosyltransferase involved in cell wall biosynthesis